MCFNPSYIFFSAFVPYRPEEKAVNYPTRPVDNTADFEGTASIQPSQPVSRVLQLFNLLKAENDV